MKYTLEERLDIGRQIYNHELSHAEAMEKYNLKRYSTDKYLNDFKRKNGIPIRSKSSNSTARTKKISADTPLDVDAYMAMSKEELIDELIRSKANELRAKKGYEVRGAGANKEFISLNSKNTK